MSMHVLDPTKFDKETLKAKALLQKRGTVSGLEKMALEVSIARLSTKSRIAAENLIEQEKRASKRLENQKRGVALSDKEITELWGPILKELDKTATRWELALSSQKQFDHVLDVYDEALKPLEEALAFAADGGISEVKSKAKAVVEVLTEAKGHLTHVRVASNNSVLQLESMLGVIKILETDPPNSREDINGARTETDKSILLVRNAEMAVKEQVLSTNNFCKNAVAKVEQLISDIVSSIVAWRQSEKTRKYIDTAESLLGGVVKAAQALNGEPLSAVAMQGIHMLIKGICSAASRLVAWFEKLDIKSKHKDVLDQIDLVQEDDYINWKLDAIKEALQWAAEPLGFIPSVGSLVVTCINAATDLIVDSIRDASKAAIEAKKNKTPSSSDQAVATAKQVFENGFKLMLEDGKDIISGSLSDPGEFIANVCKAILGPPLQALLSKVLPAMEPVDKDKLKDTVKGGRASLVEQAKHVETMNKIDTKFSFDEKSSVEKNQQALKAMAEGVPADVLVGVSDALPGPKCVVLVGAGHDPLNRNFVESLIKNGDGHSGVVVMGKKGAFGELRFSVPSEAQDLVTRYFTFYKKEITGKAVKFA